MKTIGHRILSWHNFVLSGRVDPSSVILFRNVSFDCNATKNGVFKFQKEFKSIAILIGRKKNDPRGRPTVTAGRNHCFCTSRPFLRPSIPTFQNKTKFKQKQCLLLAKLWVWPSGSLIGRKNKELFL